ncbi:chemotaxis protein CheW [Pseudomonas sp. HK3]
MNNPSSPKPTVTQSAHVATVVQEYMDNLLVDLFPDMASDIEEVVERAIEEPSTFEPQQAVMNELTVPDEPVISEAPVASKQDDVEPVVILDQPQPQINVNIEPIEIDAQPSENIDVVPEVQVETDSQIIDEPKVASKALRYPKAPIWAQEAFEVLLFDVCGLKLAVSMEALGKIIKVEHETNQLIGRPDWFIGAYIENEQHLYVVDTAKYIMPEKGFNLADDGFDYVIQLQRSKWSLACKKVYSTVRLEPDQVKWRSQQGKRQWLSGTVVDHMCALIHVDSLIDLLEAEAK